MATGSSSYSGWAASGANNGDRRGLNGGQDGGWVTAQTGFPAWLQIDFSGSKTIDEIDVFTVQDNWMNPSEPTESMIFSVYGLTGYEVQYWNGTNWVTVPGGSVTATNNVWRKFTFSPITTRKIRVLSNASTDGYSRLTEVEAWGIDSTLYEAPIADVSGPYGGTPGTGVQFSGLASHDNDGWITSYQWSFGDGTTATGETPIHTYGAEGTYTVRLTVTDNSGASSFTETTASVNAQTVVMNFDNLPTGFIVTNQYPQVTFSASGFSAGFGGPSGFDLYTTNNSGLGSSLSNAISSDNNQTRYNPNYCRGFGEAYLDFPVPVNNLSFKMLNVYENYRCDFYFCGYYQITLAYMDVYVNRFYYGTYYVNTLGQPRPPAVPIVVNNLSSIQNITGVKIYNVRNNDAVCHQTLFDDFTFTPDFDVRITSGRVSGVLNETTQKALVGADIALSGSVVPGTRTGGSYSWTFTGPYALVGGSVNSSSVTIRSTDVGTITAKLNYSLSGEIASTHMDINAILPTLTNFTGTEAADRVVRNGCGGYDEPPPTTFYSLGCPNAVFGMLTSATAKIPAGPYLSDPAQSGIKSVQIVNSLRKEMQGTGSIKCQTARTQEADVLGGWQLDTGDPSNSYGYPTRRFSEGNLLTMPDVDSPRTVLELITVYGNLEASYVDEIFETYVFYFVGNPASPIFQRPLGLENSGYPVARVAWGWGGLVVYDPGAPAGYRITSSRTVPGTYPAQSVASVRSYSGNAANLQFIRCPSGPDFVTSLIDGSRFFVRQQYCDIYSREPDQGGWDYWTGEITKCGFDMDCRNSIHGRRAAVAASFFYEAEAQQVDPDLANPPGSPNFNPAVYDPAFVRHCYTAFLRRQPEPDGLAFWVDNLNHVGDYLGVIQAFITSAEYRNRTFSKDVCVTPIH